MQKYLQLCTIAIIILMLNLTYVSTIAITTASSQPDPEDPEQTVLQKIYLYMRKGKLLHPESPTADETPKTIACPSNSEPMFPRLPFNKPRVYTWVSLPTNFETNSVSGIINLGHSVLFRLHFTATEEQSLETIRFKFTLMQGNYGIAESDPVSYSNLASGTDAFVTATAGINITGNQISSGDTLELHIDYYVTGEGLAIKYDNPLYDSGIEIEANPIKIKEIKATQSKITTYYSDAFNVNSKKMTFIAMVDNFPITEIPTSGTDTIGRNIAWPVNLKKGTHEISVSISYGSNANESMVMQRQEVRIVIILPVTFLGLTLGTWIAIIALIIIFSIIGAVIKIWRSRRDEARYREMMGY